MRKGDVLKVMNMTKGYPLNLFYDGAQKDL